MKAGRAGAIETILCAMSTHNANAGLCEAGCGALVNITWNCTHHKYTTHFSQDCSLTFIVENAARLKRLNAVGTIQAIQSTHPNLSDKINAILGRICN